MTGGRAPYFLALSVGEAAPRMASAPAPFAPGVRILLEWNMDLQTGCLFLSRPPAYSPF
jgi:hypothetical protein